MARKKRKQEEEAENTERWLVSYADFITLLFAFFVTMYAISRVDEQKLGSAVESLQRALGSLIPMQISQRESGAFSTQTAPFDPNIIASVDATAKTFEVEAFQRLAEEVQNDVQKALGEAGQNGSSANNPIQYFIDKRGLVIRVPERLFFNSGEAAIREEFRPILNALGNALGKIPNHIRVEGHTDSVPISNIQFPSNWELSTARATTIVRYLIAYNSINPGKISATGYGEFRPIAENGIPEGRMQNRRVDLVVLNIKEGEKEPASERVPPTPPPVQFPRPSTVATGR